MTKAILRDVQVLLDRPKGEGMIVSCYADTSLAAGFQSFWSQRLKNEIAQVEQRLAGDHQARLRFNRDVAVIRHALEDPAVHGTRGMAVFSAAERQFSLGASSRRPSRVTVKTTFFTTGKNSLANSRRPGPTCRSED